MRQIKHTVLKIYNGAGITTGPFARSAGGGRGWGGEALKGGNLTHSGERIRARRNIAGTVLLWRNVNFFRAVD